jgi:hypothetical protein
VSAPSGGLHASVVDLLKLLRVLRSGGGAVLRPESVIAMGQPHAPTGTGAQDAYGYGMISTRHRGATLLFHSGQLPDAAGIWGLFPQRGFGAVVLVNTGRIPEPALMRAAGLFLGLAEPESPPQGRPASEWSRYVGTYRDEAGQLGSVAVTVEGGRLWLRFVGREPVEGLPPRVTFFPGDGAQAQFLVTNIGVAQRVPERGENSSLKKTVAANARIKRPLAAGELPR